MKQSHGHVVPRTDKIKVRCGGPALCPVCRLEKAELTYQQTLDKLSNEIKNIGHEVDKLNKKYGL